MCWLAFSAALLGGLSTLDSTKVTLDRQQRSERTKQVADLAREAHLALIAWTTRPKGREGLARVAVPGLVRARLNAYGDHVVAGQTDRAATDAYDLPICALYDVESVRLGSLLDPTQQRLRAAVALAQEHLWSAPGVALLEDRLSRHIEEWEKAREEAQPDFEEAQRRGALWDYFGDGGLGGG